jgi:DNA-binding transcriptional MerR regulator
MGEAVRTHSGEASAPTYTISQLATEFGLTPRSIRFYEDQGLLMPARDGQTRIYSRRERARLVLICRGKRMGFSIAEIKEFLALYAADGREAEQLRYVLHRGRMHRRMLEAQLRDLQMTLKELEQMEAESIARLQTVGVADGDIAAVCAAADAAVATTRVDGEAALITTMQQG